MAWDIGLIFLAIFVPITLSTLLLCFYCCGGRRLASQAIALPPEEATEIINAMQGDWDVTFTPGAGTWRGGTYFERMSVTGSKIKRVHAASLGKNPALPAHDIRMKPKRSTNGDLILDALGSRAIVFTPEQGTMEIQMMGWKSEWRKVGYQQVASSGSGCTADASSGSGGIAEEITNLNELRQQGVLSEEEFLAAKNRLIYPDPSTGAPSSSYDHPPSYPGDLEAGLPLKSY